MILRYTYCEGELCGWRLCRCKTDALDIVRISMVKPRWWSLINPKLLRVLQRVIMEWSTLVYYWVMIVDCFFNCICWYKEHVVLQLSSLCSWRLQQQRWKRSFWKLSKMHLYVVIISVDFCRILLPPWNRNYVHLYQLHVIHQLSSLHSWRLQR